MSRRKRYWLKVLGTPAAPRGSTSKLDTRASGAGGNVDKMMMNLPSGNVQGQKSKSVGTRAMGERKMDLIRSWCR